MSITQQQLGGLGGLAGCGQLGSAFGGGGFALKSQLQATDRAMLDARLAFAQGGAGKAEPDGLREELQAETDEWLKDIK